MTQENDTTTTKKHDFLRKQAEQNPTDPEPTKDFVAFLVAEGHQLEAVRTLYKAFDRLEGLLLPEQIHKPIMTTMMDQGMLEPVEMLVCDLEQRYDVDDDITIKRLVRKGRREIRKRFGIFSDKIKGEDWWRKGPHVLDETRYEDWFPGNVFKIREDVISIRVWGHTEHNCLDSFMVQIKQETLTKKVEEGQAVEVGIPDDGQIVIEPYSEP